RRSQWGGPGGVEAGARKWCTSGSRAPTRVMLGAMRAGAAVSRAEDVRLAARDAATRALDAGGLDEAACLIVAATPEHLDESVELCGALRDAAGPNVQIVGGATSAALAPGGAVMEDGPALGVLGLAQRAELSS